MGAACGCCSQTDEEREAPKDDDRRDREPLLQSEELNNSLNDVNPTDQLINEQPAITLEQQHIDLVTNHPLSSGHSPSKAQVYVQRRSRSPSRQDGSGFENPQEPTETREQFRSSERDDDALLVTDVQPQVLPNVIETSALLHNQGPLISPLVPQPTVDKQDDQILKGGSGEQHGQDDPKFDAWVSAQENTIGAVNRDSSGVLFDLQNNSTTPPGYFASSPQYGNQVHSGAPQHTPSPSNESNTVPTIDWSGNVLRQPQSSSPDQFHSGAEFGPQSSVFPMVPPTTTMASQVTTEPVPAITPSATNESNGVPHSIAEKTKKEKTNAEIPHHVKVPPTNKAGVTGSSDQAQISEKIADVQKEEAPSGGDDQSKVTPIPSTISKGQPTVSLPKVEPIPAIGPNATDNADESRPSAAGKKKKKKKGKTKPQTTTTQTKVPSIDEADVKLSNGDHNKHVEKDTTLEKVKPSSSSDGKSEVTPPIPSTTPKGIDNSAAVSQSKPEHRSLENKEHTTDTTNTKPLAFKGTLTAEASLVAGAAIAPTQAKPNVLEDSTKSVASQPSKDQKQGDTQSTDNANYSLFMDKLENAFQLELDQVVAEEKETKERVVSASLTGDGKISKDDNNISKHVTATNAIPDVITNIDVIKVDTTASKATKQVGGNLEISGGDKELSNEDSLMHTKPDLATANNMTPGGDVPTSQIGGANLFMDKLEDTFQKELKQVQTEEKDDLRASNENLVTQTKPDVTVGDTTSSEASEEVGGTLDTNSLIKVGDVPASQTGEANLLMGKLEDAFQHELEQVRTEEKDALRASNENSVNQTRPDVTTIHAVGKEDTTSHKAFEEVGGTLDTNALTKVGDVPTSQTSETNSFMGKLEDTFQHELDQVRAEEKEALGAPDVESVVQTKPDIMTTNGAVKEDTTPSKVAEEGGRILDTNALNKVGDVPTSQTIETNSFMGKLEDTFQHELDQVRAEEKEALGAPDVESVVQTKPDIMTTNGAVKEDTTPSKVAEEGGRNLDTNALNKVGDVPTTQTGEANLFMGELEDAFQHELEQVRTEEQEALIKPEMDSVAQSKPDSPTTNGVVNTTSSKVAEEGGVTLDTNALTKVDDFATAQTGETSLFMGKLEDAFQHELELVRAEEKETTEDVPATQPSDGPKPAGVGSVDVNANLQRLEVQEVGIPELDEEYKAHVDMFNEYFDKFNKLQADHKKMMTTFEKIGLKSVTLLPVFIMLKGQLDDAAKQSMKLERARCYQIVFDEGLVSKEAAAVFQDFNTSNMLLTDLIGEESHSGEITPIAIDFDKLSREMISDSVIGQEREKTEGAVSKMADIMRNVVPNMNYMKMAARKVQDDLEGAAIVLFTSDDEKERVEEHCIIKRSSFTM